MWNAFNVSSVNIESVPIIALTISTPLSVLLEARIFWTCSVTGMLVGVAGWAGLVTCSWLPSTGDVVTLSILISNTWLALWLRSPLRE